MYLGKWTWSRQLAQVQTEHQNKGDASDFDCVMFSGARQAGLTRPETAGNDWNLTHNHLQGLQKMLHKR